MNQFDVTQYEFTPQLFEEFNNNHYAKDLWPLVYILSDGKVKEAYVGETTDAYARMGAHLKHDQKKKLTSVHLITSDKFNKSATLDIESNLIKYLDGDGQYKLMNGNLGLANHNYYQKNEVYWGIFNSIWDSLRAKGVAKHSIDHINNSDLFKYSPYKSLTNEQRDGLFSILELLLNDSFENIIIEGGAGTGKTILAIFLFKILVTNNEDFNFKEFGDDESKFINLINNLKAKYPNPKMGLVVPMASFRTTLKKVFKNIKGLNSKMVIGPANVSKEKFDLLVVDESHRLRRRANLGAYYGAFDIASKKLGLDKNNSSELDWVVMQSKKTILFYDEAQSIKPSDTKKEDFDALKKNQRTIIKQLKSQFRVKGGNAYVDFIDKVLHCKKDADEGKYNSKDYEFLLFDSLEEMITQIQARDQENGLSRLIAGYSWPWISNKDQNAFDIQIENIKLKWNGTSNDWINSENSLDEVGCIHTTQGYDLNYSGIIFGNEISYDKHTNQIIINEESYFDKNGKQSIKDPLELKAFIINIYKTILLRGIKGTYVYVCDDDLRTYLSQFIPNVHKEKDEITFLSADEVKPYENSIPLFDLKAAAGEFGNIQYVDEVQWIKPPDRYKPSKDLFCCQVVGESMNKIIPNGSICLFRKYTGGSRNGRICLVEYTDLQDADFGSCYTVKEYQSKKSHKGESWEHEKITLKPLSTNSDYEDIILEKDETNQLKVVGIFEAVL